MPSRPILSTKDLRWRIPKMSFVEKVKLSRGNLVYLVRGKDDGKPAWHYVFVDKLKQPLFLEAVESGTVDCAQFGEILESGWGENPNPEITRSIEKRYG